MGRILLEFGQEDYELVKSILGRRYPSVAIKVEGKDAEAIELPSHPPARDIYGIMAVFLENKVAWK